LRTIWGVSLERIKKPVGAKYHTYIMEQSSKKIGKDGITFVEKGRFTGLEKGEIFE